MPAKRYRAWNPRQSFLLPPSPLEWLPEDHLAFFVLEVVDAIDLSEIERAIQAKDARGTRPYPPKMMVGLLAYGYCVGVFSSRKLARATYDDVAFRVLAGGTHPCFTTINEFRLTHHQALAGLFSEFLRLCREVGLVNLGHVSYDGSKVQANASKHKAMSYERMTAEQARLEQEVEALLAKADAVDAEEDRLYGKGQDAHDLPEELRRRETRLAKIQEAKAALEKEAAEARARKLRENAAGQRAVAADSSVEPTERKRAATRAAKSEQRADELDGDDRDDSAGGSPTLPLHQTPATPDGLPKPNAQRNFTDPDSRIMKNNTGYVQAYNVQIAVNESQVIVAHGLTNQAPDPEHLVPMLERTIANCGEPPDRLSADSGYCTEANIDACDTLGIDAYIATGRGDTATRNLADIDIDTEPLSTSQVARWQMFHKLQTPTGKAIYARRKAIAEPPFGQIKEARGFRRFSLRGLAKVSSEWAFVCATHNLLKLYRAVTSTKSIGYTPTALAPA
jgi:transposase